MYLARGIIISFLHFFVAHVFVDSCPHCLSKSCFVERKMEYTRESLLEFKSEMQKQAILAKTGGGQGGFGGFGGGAGGGANEKEKKPSLKVCLILVFWRFLFNIAVSCINVCSDD